MSAFTRLFSASLLSLALTLSAAAAELTIASWNLEWFYDHDTNGTSQLAREQSAPSAADFQARVAAFADAIATLDPDILAVQEIENEGVLQALAAALQTQHGRNYAVAFVQGLDTHTQQDVGFLVRNGLDFSAQRFTFTMQGNSDFKDLRKHLALTVTVGGEPLTLLTAHLRCCSAVAERKRQARTIRSWLGERIATENIIVLGDLNSGLAVNQTVPDSDIGIIRGFQTSTEADDLFDVHETLNGIDRETHVGGSPLDRILLSPSLTDDTGLRFLRAANRRDLATVGAEDTGSGVTYELPDTEQDVSDHFPLVAVFETEAEQGGDTPTRAQLLTAIEQIGQQLRDLQAQVNTLQAQIERLPN